MRKFPKFKSPFSCILILIILSLNFSCSHTKLMNLSKKEIAGLDTIYYQNFNHKFFDTEWVLYEKQICQLKVKFVRQTTYTGTWVEKNDTIYVNFFYRKGVANERKLLVNKTTGEIRDLLK